jgi:hypothetical protein
MHLLGDCGPDAVHPSTHHARRAVRRCLCGTRRPGGAGDSRGHLRSTGPRLHGVHPPCNDHDTTGTTVRLRRTPGEGAGATTTTANDGRPTHLKMRRSGQRPGGAQVPALQRQRLLPGLAFVGRGPVPRHAFVGRGPVPRLAFVGRGPVPRHAFVGRGPVPRHAFAPRRSSPSPHTAAPFARRRSCSLRTSTAPASPPAPSAAIAAPSPAASPIAMQLPITRIAAIPL